VDLTVVDAGVVIAPPSPPGMNSVADARWLLSAVPSWKGVGRILNLGSIFDSYNYSGNPDALALQMDFRAVGAALWGALAQLVSQPVASQQ
jgi:hypothetical protein